MNLDMLCEYEQRAREEGDVVKSHENLLGMRNSYAADFERQAAKRIHGQMVYNNRSHVYGTETEVVTKLRIEKKNKFDIPDASSARTKRVATAAMPKTPMLKIEKPPPVKELESTPATERPFEHYEGDFFSTRGNYLEGLLYRSRMKKKLTGLDNMQIRRSSVTEPASFAESIVPMTSSNMPFFDEKPDLNEVENRRRYTSTLCNWSSILDNAKNMVKEGIVEALIDQASFDDMETKTSCATAFKNLSLVAELRTHIVHSNAVKTIVKLATSGSARSSDSEELVGLLQDQCALTLCNLSAMLGAEEKLVQDGAVTALVMLMNDNENIAPVCEWALFNFTCVDKSYTQIENVIKAFITLASTCGPSSKEVCTASLYNLSLIHSIRSRMVDEGLIQVLSSLCWNSNQRVRHLLAFVAYNISLKSSCRSEMVTKGIVSALSSIIATKDHKIRHVVAATMANLCEDRNSRIRIVSEDGLVIISSIASCVSQFPTTRLCGYALYKLCSTDDNRLKVVERGGVLMLSQLAASDDEQTREHATLAMCFLLTVQQATADILQCGAVSALILLSSTTNEVLRGSCALALLNICRSKVALNAIKSENMLEAILGLTSAEAISTKLNCVAALYYLASNAQIREYMSGKEVVAGIVEMLGIEPSNEYLQRYSISTLCMLAENEDCAMTMVSEGALNPLIRASHSSDIQTQTTCCAVLASMTNHPSGRRELMKLGILEALVRMAGIRDADVQQRCAAAFGNLSREVPMQEKMVELNVVSVIAKLSNSYQENNQFYCACALYNLSMLIGEEQKIVEQGAVDAILMIAIVRAVSLATKERCAYALVNMLNANTLEAMIKSGLVQALSNLSTYESSVITKACSTSYFLLSTHATGRIALCKAAPLHAMLALLSRESGGKEIKETLANTLCVLVTSENSVLAALENGAFGALNRLIENSPDSDVLLKVAKCFLPLSASATTRKMLMSLNCIDAIIRLLNTTHVGSDAELTDVELQSVTVVAMALENFAMDDACLLNINAETVVPCIIQLISNVQLPDILRASASILCSLSVSKKNCLLYITCNLFESIRTLCKAKEVKTLESCCLLLRDIASVMDSTIKETTYKLVIQLWCELVINCTDPISVCNLSDAFCSLSQKVENKSLLISESVLSSIEKLLLQNNANVARRCASGLRAIAIPAEKRTKLASLRATKLLVSIASNTSVDMETLIDCAAAFRALSQDEASRKQIVDEGAIPVLISLSEKQDQKVLNHCSFALSYLSHSGHTIGSGSVTALITMNLADLDSNAMITNGVFPDEWRSVSNDQFSFHESTDDAVAFDEFPVSKLELEVADCSVASIVSPNIKAIDEDSNSTQTVSRRPSTSNVSATTTSMSNDAILQEKFNLQKIDPQKRSILGGKTFISTDSNSATGTDDGNELSSTIEEEPSTSRRLRTPLSRPTTADSDLISHTSSRRNSAIGLNSSRPVHNDTPTSRRTSIPENENEESQPKSRKVKLSKISKKSNAVLKSKRISLKSKEIQIKAQKLGLYN